MNDFKMQNRFQVRIAETYRSFGLNALGMGASYGKQAGVVTQPVLVPVSVLGHHLEDLAALIQASDYKYGILLQLNNLDVGEIHESKHLKYLFNELRDYVQTNNVSWLLVGDKGLRRFIAQDVDRLDDIISYEVEIAPLSLTDYIALIDKRVQFYKNNSNAELPIDKDVFLYLFKLTEGRLRYVFGLIKRLLHEASIGDLVDKLTLDLTKPMVIKLARERLSKNGLSKTDEKALKMIVKLRSTTATALAQEINTTRQYIKLITPRLAAGTLRNGDSQGEQANAPLESPSARIYFAQAKYNQGKNTPGLAPGIFISRMLVRLNKINLLEVKQEGRNRIYSPVLDVSIAYGEH